MMNDDLVDLGDDLTSPLDDFTSPKNDLDPSKSLLNQAPPFDFLAGADDDGDLAEVEPMGSTKELRGPIKMEADEPVGGGGGGFGEPMQTSFQNSAGAAAAAADDENDCDEDKLDEDDFVIENSDSKTPGEILDEFCLKFQDINTTLPDSVVNHYMKKAGFIVNDRRLIKIISIASQKFIAEIVNDIMQHHKLKTKSAPPPPPAAAGAGAGGGANKGGQAGAAAAAAAAAASAAAAAAAQQPGGNLTLTLEDLTQVLNEYGISIKKPYYFM